MTDTLSPLRVVAFSGGKNVPSARFRIRQYLGDLSASGIEVDEYYPARGSAYPPVGMMQRPAWLASQLAQRIIQVHRARGHDLTVLQRQMVSTINTLESLSGRPRLFDVDDAVWLSARFGSVDRLVSGCDGVICGNEYLAEYFSRCNRSIHIVPTAVDARIWTPSTVGSQSTRRHIGWIGTRGNLKYLEQIENALTRVLDRVRDADILVVSDAPPRFSKIDPDRVLYRPWSEHREVEDIQSMYVGVMPLKDSPWTRGKCSFKMLQYMACGVPAVVSPVGMNVKVAQEGGGFLARNESEWIDHLTCLLRDDDRRQQSGEQARRAILDSYSTEIVAAQLATVFRCYV